MIFVIFGALLSGCSGRHHGKKSVDEKTETSAIDENLARMANMSPEEMMKKAKTLGSPTPAHTVLQPLVGTWVTETKWWKAPGEKPEVSKGRANHQWAFGKRFIKEKYEGKFAGEAFQGEGMIGYDNVKKEYVSTWADSMSTDIMTGEGSYDPATKSLEMTSKFTCPITESEMKMRSVTRILNNNQHVLEMYGMTPDGKEFKSMEITYKRKS